MKKIIFIDLGAFGGIWGNLGAFGGIWGNLGELRENQFFSI